MQDIRKKIFHITVLILIIFTILMVAGMIILRYEVEGEFSLPFSISKIIIVSTAEGENKELENNYKWNFDISQNNDIYIAIEKDKNKNELIKSVVIDNIQVKEAPKMGQVNFFRPNLDDGAIFKNSEENKIDDRIEYVGGEETDVKKAQIGNMGGTILFRSANINLGTYSSNKDEITHDGKMLKKVDATVNKLRYTISFEITVSLTTDKVYKAGLELQLPVGNVIEEGTCSTEKTDFADVVFKHL